MSWVAGTLSTTLLHTAIPLLCREVIELSFTLSGLCCWTTMPHGENCSEGRCKRVLGLFFSDTPAKKMQQVHAGLVRLLAVLGV